MNLASSDYSCEGHTSMPDQSDQVDAENIELLSVYSSTSLKPIDTRPPASNMKRMCQDGASQLESNSFSVDDQGPGNEGWRTPKAKAYRIPELLDCPPAPRKRRAYGRKTLPRKTSFFNPPDFDLFFPRQKLQV
ncbi:hypothetical protein O6H91_02G071300 [Diphasiastrum complanatum]|uniref:Uncharacterized protein n=1 Tax=Diphasiastrum complanatum TaxID=34168 RepID=A0ACC2EH17_DIPCM|nr:hypothetical protein O6H91_02G071300 [Diphasiastrum complanatum]